MTLRAIILGLIAAMVVVTLDVFNKTVWRLGLSFDKYLPEGVYGLLMVGVLVVGPLLYRIRPRWRLSGKELAVILGMALVSCHVTGTGWLTHVPQTLSMPLHLNASNPGWRRYDLMSYVPPAMLINQAKYDPVIIQGLIGGLGKPGEPIGLGQVPWQAWGMTLTYWISIIALLSIASVCLGLIVHRQWAQHERLRYPIAEFASSLIRQEPGRSLGPIYHDRFFWIGFGVIMFIHMVNYIHFWAPTHTPQIPWSFDFTAIVDKYPTFGGAFVTHFMATPTIFPMAMAFAYFLSFDVGLSLWSSHLLHGIARLLLTTAGIATGSNFILGGWSPSIRFGGYVGMMAILLYTGRRYYGQVTRRAVGAGGEAPAAAGWALRIAVVASTAVVVLLIGQGLDWPLAILAVGMLLILFVVASRMSAEGGLFAIEARWAPLGIMLGLIGMNGLGIQNLFILGVLSMVLCVGASEFVMGYVVNSLKVGEILGVRAPQLSRSMGISLLLALGLGVVLSLWASYNYGFWQHDWFMYNIPGRAFLAPYRSAVSLTLTGGIEEVENFQPLERFARMQPQGRFITWSLAGFGAVLLFGMMRLRFTWWPLHSIFILIWGSWLSGVYSFSVLLGWGLKVIITRFGGAKLYNRLKPMMIGFIAANVSAPMIRLLVGAIYYAVTGTRPGD